MNDWSKLKAENKSQMLAAMKELSPEEQVILHQVLKFELENRHVSTPRFGAPLKAIIERSVR